MVYSVVDTVSMSHSANKLSIECLDGRWMEINAVNKLENSTCAKTFCDTRDSILTTSVEDIFSFQ